jgi:hypothetical protein
MRICNVCKEEKEDDNFLFRNKEKGTKHSACSLCYKDIRKRSYEKNKKYYIDKSKRYEKDIRDWYHEIKSSLKCQECGFSHPAALDFHHIGKKESEVSNIIKSCNKDRILEEIEKCIVLCSNCHRIHHFNERRGNLAGAKASLEN